MLLNIETMLFDVFGLMRFILGSYAIIEQALAEMNALQRHSSFRIASSMRMSKIL